MPVKGVPGRRLADDALKNFAEGDYARIGGSWWIRPPGGHLGELTEHEVEEHEDGTISVRPSIVDCKHGVHVYLDHGVWRQV